MADYRVVSVLSALEPVALDEAKNYIRITNDQDDDLVTNMIVQARQMAEAYLSKDIVAKSREVYYPFVSQEVYLPFAPIDTSVDIEVTIDGTLQTSDAYTLFGYENPSLRIPSGSRDVKIGYTTKGLGSEVKQGVLAATAFLYDAAGRRDLATIQNIMMDWKVLLAPYRRLYI